MRQFRRGLLLAAGAAALTACASTGPVNSTGAAAATAGPAQSAVPHGYRRVVRKGTEYFCRTQPVTGSHTLKNEICLTREELDAERTHKVTAGLTPPSPAQVGTSMPAR